MNTANGDEFSRDSAIKTIRKALRLRSGKDWSVRGGRGTAWGWIKIDAPPRRRLYGWDGEGDGSHMSKRDREELGGLLGYDKPVHAQGEGIPASWNYRRLYMNRAIWGDACGATAEPYWD